MKRLGVVSAEYLLVAGVVLAGAGTAMNAVRDAVVESARDVSGLLRTGIRQNLPPSMQASWPSDGNVPAGVANATASAQASNYNQIMFPPYQGPHVIVVQVPDPLAAHALTP